MPQPKSSRAAKPAARKPAAKKPAARKPATKKPAAARKPAAAAKKPAASAARKPAARKAAAKKPAAKKPAAAARKPAARRSAAKPAARRPAARKAPARRAAAAGSSNLGNVRELLSDGLMLSAQRIQDALDDAVERGKLTRRDAESLAKNLLDEGRRQTAAFLADVEQLLGRSRSDLESAASTARTRAGTATKRARASATKRGDRVLREVDKARRTAGVGPSFPILGFDDLSAAQVSSRLKDLKPAQLRKVRDYERRNANRKSVLGAVEKALA